MWLKVTLGAKEQGERLAGNRSTMTLKPKVAFLCLFLNLLQQSIVDIRGKTPMVSLSSSANPLPNVSAYHALNSFAGSLDLG